MKQTLLNKYLEGETTASEERELKRLLLDSPRLTSTETAVLKLLSYDLSDSEEEDIFVVDYTEEYEKVTHRHHYLYLWPYLVAACVVALLIVLLTPPRKEMQQVANLEKTDSTENVIKETVKTVPAPHPIKEKRLIAHKTKRMPKVLKTSVQDNVRDTETKHMDLAFAMSDEQKDNDVQPTKEENSRVMQQAMAFRTYSETIRERGQQVIHRVALIQQEQQKNQQQFAEI